MHMAIPAVNAQYNLIARVLLVFGIICFFNVYTGFAIFKTCINVI